MALADSAATFPRLFQVIELGVTNGTIYALIALGYTLVYGIIEMINFFHGEVFMWGTVMYFFALGWLHLDSAISDTVTLAVILFGIISMCMLLCGAMALLLERVVYRPLSNAPRLTRLIAAIAASFILENVALFLIGPSTVPVPSLFPNQGWMILGAHIKYLDAFTILLSVGLMVGLAAIVNRTRVGRAIRSVAQDRETASLMGVDTNRIIALTFILGGALAGAAGVAYSMITLSAYYFTGFKVGLVAFTAAILGGIGNIYGAMLGGICIGLVEAFVISYVPDGAAWAEATVFVVLTLVLVFRPVGFLGRAAPEQA